MEELIMCPYNPAHMIRASRMQYHLVKCKKEYEERQKKDLKTCPFNATHQIEKSSYKAHLEDCPDRKLFDAFKFSTEPEGMPSNEVPAVGTSNDEEVWSQDAPSYDPCYNSSRSVITVLKGAKPSERKAHRMEQRRNYDSNN